ncbi:MAG: YybH family protein [Planctomycetota bacterium]
MTETQREVWRTVEELNQAWTSGPGDEVARFFHPRIVAFTATDRDRLEGADACTAAWQSFAQAASTHRFDALDPRVDIYGTVAVVTYAYDMDCTIGGKEVRLAGRDMLVLVEEDGRWQVIADHFAPYPDEAAGS